MSEVKGVLHRFARKGEYKLYVTVYNGDYLLWVVKNGIVIRQDNYFREDIEAETAFEKEKNKL